MPAERTIGRVIAELAVELDRIYACREDALAGDIGKVFVAAPAIGPRTGGAPRRVRLPALA